MMKKSMLLLACTVTAMSLFAQKSPAKADKKAMNPGVELKTAIDSANYAFGIVMGANASRQMGTELNKDIFSAGMNASLSGEGAKMTPEEANKYFSEFNKAQQARAVDKNKMEGKRFMDENKKRKEVTTTATGLQYEVLKHGTGTVHPTATDKVEVHYHGTLLDGSVFDSSVERGKSISFALNGVIKGWTEGVQLMVEGDKFKFFIPSELAYGDRAAGAKIKPGSTLVFEVELLKINP